MKLPLKQYWTLLSKYLKPQRGPVLWLMLSLFTHIGLQLVNPQILRYFIDTATANGPLSNLINAALIFIGVAIISQGLSIVNRYLSENVAWTATNLLRLNLTAHCFRLDQSFHKAHTPGELIERIDGDVNALSNFFSQFVIHVLANLLLVIGILGLLFGEDWRIGLGLSGFVVLALLIVLRVRTIATPYWKAFRQISADFFGFLGEQLTGLEDLGANGASDYVMRRLYEILRRWLPVRIKADLGGYSMWMINIAVFAAGNAIAFGMSAYLFSRGAITIGTVYLIFYYTELLRGPISQLRNQLTDLQQAEASISRIEELLATTSSLPEGQGPPPSEGALSVAFDDVSFSYDGQESVLQNVTFQLQPGRVLGLLGRTGSGKTTIARLLLRLYDPSTGEIRLGGITPPTTTLSGLRRRIGMVTQDVQLFQGTVRDNLTFFNSAISDERLEAVLNDLGLSVWLASLPSGLDTTLEPGGSNLSAGQAQLLALARVFLTDPGLVILDEASSRLDPATEGLIERAIDKLLANRTGIIIAHRLSTVRRADEILILANGGIVEHGDRLALASDPDSQFSQLLQTGLEGVLA